MLTPFLTDAQQAVLKDERRLLADLRAELAASGATHEIQQTLARSVDQLDELFLVVVVGEFNAGKSAFVNALVGRAVLPEGVTPTTAEITLLRHGEADRTISLGHDLIEITAPLALLRELHVVDTPGTNAILREHQAITEAFVPRSDLVIFVTSADRPFTETERAFLERVRDWGKKILVVVNKIDILAGESEIDEVVRFVRDGSLRLLGIAPEVFPVSARAAQRAWQGDPAARAASRFEALEAHLRATLDDAGRVRLKLLNPLGVAHQVVTGTLKGVGERLALLRDDFAMLEDVDRQLDLYEQDMLREFGVRMTGVENVLLELERRGHDYFDEMLRLGRVFDLVNRARVEQGFTEQVVADAPRRIENKVNEMIDWIVDADFRQWQAVTGHLAERRRAHRDRIVGEADPTGFHSDRSRLIDGVGREAQRVVDAYDRRAEASALADGARGAVAAAAAMGAGAVGLGTIVSLAASSAAADITGLVAAGAIAALGFFVIPARRRRAKRELRAKITALRESLSGALRRQFESELGRSAHRIREAVAPYTRFVRAEGDRLSTAEQTFRTLDQEIDRLRTAIQAL